MVAMVILVYLLSFRVIREANHRIDLPLLAIEDI